MLIIEIRSFYTKVMNAAKSNVMSQQISPGFANYF